MWLDIAEWIRDSWPWPCSATQCHPLPLRIQLADVGFDEYVPHRATTDFSDSDQHASMDDTPVSLYASVVAINLIVYLGLYLFA